MSTGGTLHNVSSIMQFHGEVIDAVLTVAVETRQRSGISVALQADGTRELGVQLTQRFFTMWSRSSHIAVIKLFSREKTMNNLKLTCNQYYYE